MKNSSEMVLVSQNQSEGDLVDVFADIEPIDRFDVKKDYVSAKLAALMSFGGKNRAEMAQELGWNRSRVTKVQPGWDGRPARVRQSGGAVGSKQRL